MDKQKILVVDDEPDIVETIKFRLETAGYHVAVGQDGIEALEYAHLEQPDLALLDIVLPKMDGYQVCRALKKSHNEKYNSIPIILMTAKEKLVGDKIQIVSEAEDYLVKPFETSDMLRRVRKWLSNK